MGYGPGLVVRGKHYLTVTRPEDAAAVWRPLQDKIYMPLLPFFFGAGVELKEKSFTSALPPNVQLVTLMQWDESQWLVRLAHQFGLSEDAELSKPVTVDLRTLF